MKPTSLRRLLRLVAKAIRLGRDGLSEDERRELAADLLDLAADLAREEL